MAAIQTDKSPRVQPVCGDFRRLAIVSTVLPGLSSGCRLVVLGYHPPSSAKGDDMPRRKTAAIGLKIDPELKAKIDAVCEAEFRSVAGLVEMLLTKYVAERPEIGAPAKAASSGKRRVQRR